MTVVSKLDIMCLTISEEYSCSGIEIIDERGIGIQDIGKIQNVITGPTLSATLSHRIIVLHLACVSQ